MNSNASAGTWPISWVTPNTTCSAYCKRGSPHSRRALYLAALTAIRTDPELGVYLQRKQAEGKAFRVALIAVARKLLARIYVVLRDQRPYAPPTPPHHVNTSGRDMPETSAPEANPLVKLLRRQEPSSSAASRGLTRDETVAFVQSGYLVAGGG